MLESGAPLMSLSFSVIETSHPEQIPQEVLAFWFDQLSMSEMDDPYKAVDALKEKMRRKNIEMTKLIGGAIGLENQGELELAIGRLQSALSVEDTKFFRSILADEVYRMSSKLSPK